MFEPIQTLTPEDVKAMAEVMRLLPPHSPLYALGAVAHLLRWHRVMGLVFLGLATAALVLH